MRKQGKDSFLREKHVRQLLEQLTKRDMESIETKISQLNSQQKHSRLHQLPLTDRYSHSKINKVSSKQNTIIARGSIGKNSIRKATTINNSPSSRWVNQSQIIHLEQKKSHQSTCHLPYIETKRLKKRSGERRSKKRRQTSELRRVDSRSTGLTVIEEETATPARHQAFGMTFGKLQKQLSSFI